jgi:hypothetical protein
MALDRARDARVSSTVRLDVRHCHSRIAQYTASPCQGSYDALVLVCRYLISTPNLCLRSRSVSRVNGASSVTRIWDRIPSPATSDGRS